MKLITNIEIKHGESFVAVAEIAGNEQWTIQFESSPVIVSDEDDPDRTYLFVGAHYEPYVIFRDRATKQWVQSWDGQPPPKAMQAALEGLSPAATS